MHREKVVIARGELINSLRGFKRFNTHHLTISVPNIQTIIFKDILELYLALSGTQMWEWIDSRGRAVERQPILVNVSNILRDIGLWPFLHWRLEREVRSLNK